MNHIEEYGFIQNVGKTNGSFHQNMCPVYVSLADIDEFKENIAANDTIYIFSKEICKNNPDFVSQAISVCRDNVQNIVVLHTDTDIHSMAVLADSYNIPLFLCAESVRIRDVLRLITSIIQTSSDEELELKNLFQMIIDGSYENQGKVVFTAQQYGINLESENAVAVLYNYDDLSASDFSVVSMLIQEQMQEMLNKKILVTSNEKEIVLILPYGELNMEEYIKQIETKAKRQGVDADIYVGIGMPTRYIDKLSESYFQARRVCKLQRVMDKREKIQYFSKLGLYNLLFYIRDKNELRRFYNNVLGKLEEYDELNDADLMETLAVYLEHNCNSQMTAQALYIHRNTLRYRLERISTILQEDLDDRLIDAEFIMAFMIKKYLKSIEHQELEDGNEKYF